LTDERSVIKVIQLGEGRGELNDDEKAFGAELIHQPIPESAETEPRLNRGQQQAIPDADLIAAVKRGERISTEYSMHASVKPEGCPGWNHHWRTIVCDGANDQDVVECRRCGVQRVIPCNFDEEYN
jgi:hypothetical protein